MSHRPAPHELDDVVEPEDRMCAEELALHVESQLGEFEHEELFEEGVLDEDDLPDDDVVGAELEELILHRQVRRP